MTTTKRRGRRRAGTVSGSCAERAACRLACARPAAWGSCARVSGRRENEERERKDDEASALDSVCNSCWRNQSSVRFARDIFFFFHSFFVDLLLLPPPHHCKQRQHPTQLIKWLCHCLCRFIYRST